MVQKSALGVIADCSLSIQIIHDRSEARLIPIGEIDVHSATTFTVAGELAIAEMPARLVIDLSQVSFIDSSGVRGIQALTTMAEEANVPCTVIGRDAVGAFAQPPAMVVWSGSTTRVVDRKSPADPG